MAKKKSSYAEKVATGNMMYGRKQQQPKYPDWKLTKRCLCGHRDHPGKTFYQCELEFHQEMMPFKKPMKKKRKNRFLAIA